MFILIIVVISSFIVMYLFCCILVLFKERTACSSVVAHRDPNNYIKKCLPSSETKNYFGPFQVSNEPIGSTLRRKKEEEVAKVSREHTGRAWRSAETAAESEDDGGGVSGV